MLNGIVIDSIVGHSDSSPLLDHWYTKTKPNGFKSLNPYKYWKEHIDYKSLRKFAMKLFIHTNSSVACERFFSVCPNIADDKRSSMAPENFSALCIVKENINYMNI